MYVDDNECSESDASSSVQPASNQLNNLINLTVAFLQVFLQ